jgi:hypothetical protein
MTKAEPQDQTNDLSSDSNICRTTYRSQPP